MNPRNESRQAPKNEHDLVSPRIWKVGFQNKEKEFLLSVKQEKPDRDTRKALKKACLDAGIPCGRGEKDGFVFHDTRH
ncbi:MAG TPA: hypothetical protein PLG94_11230 [Smithellaceae bacterium]|nr:hypothetical protein [Smithellaceae bacterium]